MSLLTDKTTTAVPTKVRDSLLELFRIILMLMIIAHHYVVNSGLSQMILQEGAGNISWRGLSFLMFGAWGKVGINCFVLITGHFMCTGRATVQKFLKLYFQILFYTVAIGLIFFCFGCQTLGISTVFYWFWPFKNLTSGFTDAFLALLLLVPFLNKLIENLDQKKHLRLLVVLLFVFSFLPTLPFSRIEVANNYVQSGLAWAAFVVICVYVVCVLLELFRQQVFVIVGARMMSRMKKVHHGEVGS